MKESKTTAFVALNGNFTAPELEQALADLAQVRAGLLPEVTQEPPTNLDTTVLEQPTPRFRIRTRAGGGLRIWLRNEGLGWLAFELSAAQRIELIEFLGQQPGHTHSHH